MDELTLKLVEKVVSDLKVVIEAQNRVVLDVLLMKGLISYADIHESIAVVRETIPTHLYGPLVKATLDVMEQTYQSGTYNNPLDPASD